MEEVTEEILEGDTLLAQCRAKSFGCVRVDLTYYSMQGVEMMD